MSDGPPRADVPTVEAETRPYWDAAADGRLLMGSCGSCGEVHHYPRPFCPTCWSDDVEWVDADGSATLYTWSTVHMNGVAPFADRVPYVAAVVDLTEGPRMMTNIVDIDPADLEIGMALEVTFRPIDGELIAPVFRAASRATT